MNRGAGFSARVFREASLTLSHPMSKELCRGPIFARLTRPAALECLGKPMPYGRYGDLTLAEKMKKSINV